MKVKVAVAQLSASAIETYSVFTELQPTEDIYTAEFLKLIDDLFDSLYSPQPRASHIKLFKGALREGIPHWDLWSKLSNLDSRFKSEYKLVLGKLFVRDMIVLV